MCGRYTITATPRQLAARFQAELLDAPWLPRYNAAPTQNLPVVLNEHSRRLDLLRWGLIPPWASDPSVGSRLINARAETLARKPAFRSALKKRRCLVLADGFYEWQKAPGGKVPMRVALESDDPFAFAGLWERWTADDGTRIRTFTIITTNANKRLKPIHDRMPVILKSECEDRWLDNDAEADELLKLLQPYPADRLIAYPVSPRVNSPRNDDPSLIQRVPDPPEPPARPARLKPRYKDESDPFDTP